MSAAISRATVRHYDSVDATPRKRRAKGPAVRQEMLASIRKEYCSIQNTVIEKIGIMHAKPKNVDQRDQYWL